MIWTAVVVLLLACRLPSLAEPAGADQALYTYVGQRLSAGDVPYRDAWDQKPPAIHAIYAAMWRVWPSDAAIAATDLLAAGLVACSLVGLGRRMFNVHVGYGAAALFLLLGNPAIQRLSGVRVRSQCETFIALAITAALVLSTGHRARRWLWAGICFGIAFWLKYNAAVYILPLLSVGVHEFSKQRAIEFCGGFLAVAGIVLGFFAIHGALTDLWLATVTYNVKYSQETYEGIRGLIGYLTFPVERVRIDLLWYLGGLGALSLLIRSRDRFSRLIIVWIAAACVSIAMNGARNLPQYFVQAHPALALSATAGVGMMLRRSVSAPLRAILIAFVLLGIWRVGDEPHRIRLGGLPEAARNSVFDTDALLGRVDRETYLSRFEIPQDVKYAPLAAARLAARIRQTTEPTDRILVFGFSSSVYVQSQRISASRFFWSRPVTVEFGAPRPTYGSAGLLRDLQHQTPAVVALQKHWGPGAPEPMEFFMHQPALRGWLEAGYVLESDNDVFAVWKRKS